MTPDLRAGDRLLVDYRRRPVVGDVVTATFSSGDLVVKRVAERRETGWFLRSDNPAAPNAMDSAARGPVRDGSVHGVVVARLWPRPGLVRRRPPTTV